MTRWQPLRRYARVKRLIWPPAQDRPARLQLPADIADGAQALAMACGLWPSLLDALEPGTTGRRYTRRSDHQGTTVITPTCDTCGGALQWRAATWPAGAVPATPALAGAVIDVERLKAYCPKCDGGDALAPSRLPINVHVFDTLVEVRLEVQLLEATLVDELNLGTVLPAAATTLDRLEHVGRLLPALDRPGVQLHAERVARTLHSIARRVQAALRDVELVVEVSGRCPHCGTRGLVMYPDRGDTNAHRIDGRVQFAAGLVICTYRECTCSDPDCRCHARDTENHGYRPYAGYRHEWPNSEWSDLGKALELDLQALAERARQ